MQAADIHLKLGLIERYCEIMVELGEVRYLDKNVIMKFFMF